MDFFFILLDFLCGFCMIDSKLIENTTSNDLEIIMSSEELLNLEECKILLQAATEIIIPYEQEWKKSGKYFDFFSALGVERKEVRHSALLATLLNPMAIHGMEDCFLKAFVKRIGFCDFITKNAIVRTEEVINGGRRLDISIVSENRKQKIVIENKIDTNDHDNQLNAYLNDLKKQYDNQSWKLVYLTLNGELPCEAIDSSEIVCLSYREDILRLLETLSKSEKQIPESIREIIRQYIITIKNITNQGFDKEMNKELMELIINDNNFDLVEKMYKQLNEIKIEVLTTFIMLLKKNFELKKRSVSISYRSESNYENAIARYAISTSVNEDKEYLTFSFDLNQDKVFHLIFDPEGWFWIEIKDNDGSNLDRDKKTSQFCSKGEEFDKINFRFPDSGFLKFARMTDEEKEKYISDYVAEIERRLFEMQL